MNEILLQTSTGGTIEYFGDFWIMKTPNTAINFYIAPKRFIQYGGDDLDRGVMPDYLVENKGNAILDFSYSLIEK